MGTTIVMASWASFGWSAGMWMGWYLETSRKRFDPVYWSLTMAALASAIITTAVLLP